MSLFPRLDEVIEAIKNRRPLSVPPEIQKLAEKVARQYRPPENIKEWAERLANDVVGADD